MRVSYEANIWATMRQCRSSESGLAPTLCPNYTSHGSCLRHLRLELEPRARGPTRFMNLRNVSPTLKGGSSVYIYIYRSEKTVLLQACVFNVAESYFEELRGDNLKVAGN